ncbi:MAG TPA: cupredoxin family protein [Hyphomicrobium sp.]|uniref:cupredoxin domain-containing protein n=1 Tax=Hyphomicrobium sp. TaxID=82 RepID=UPI002BE24074|nr:cupredoxin family protein [Hyphomicrobium sp.]HRN87385.1 cupredoxin family protein [Hyphomicrobium sp.]
MLRFSSLGVLTAILLTPTSVWSHGSFVAGEPGDPSKPARTIELNMIEGSGTMSYSVDRVEVKKGEQIRFRITNAGELGHEFMLDSIERNARHKIEMQKNPEMEHDDPNGVRLEPGKVSEILWKFENEGTFEFACLIPGHYEAGMHGTVVVKP